MARRATSHSHSSEQFPFRSTHEPSMGFCAAWGIVPLSVRALDRAAKFAAVFDGQIREWTTGVDWAAMTCAFIQVAKDRGPDPDQRCWPLPIIDPAYEHVFVVREALWHYAVGRPRRAAAVLSARGLTLAALGVIASVRPYRRRS